MMYIQSIQVSWAVPSATLPSTANSPDLKPEFTEEIELGTQLSFAKRRVELDFTWYNRQSTNLIAIITTPLHQAT